MAYSISFSEEKNQLLQAIRGVSFEDVIKAIKNKKLLDNIVNTSLKRAHQKVYVVKMGNYIYAVPYIINHRKKAIYFKTVYPSRKLTKHYTRRRK